MWKSRKRRNCGRTLVQRIVGVGLEEEVLESNLKRAGPKRESQFRRARRRREKGEKEAHHDRVQVEHRLPVFSLEFGGMKEQVRASEDDGGK